MNFDDKINRIGSHSAKWDMIKPLYGVEPEDALSMWVADMDFRPPQCVLDRLQAFKDHGVFGYYGDDASYRTAITGWMERRHGWTINPAHISNTHGLVNGTALCLQAFTNPGDGVVLFTPIYHAFARVIAAAGRNVVECEMTNTDGHYSMDFDAADAQMTGSETMMILCSPHNPGGRVWTADELRAAADFCKRHDLILVSDEIHHDLVFGGAKHIPMPLAAPDIADRLVMMTAASKTFNIAGSHVGNVIISDDALRAKFTATLAANGISANSFGMHMVEAAYAEGDAWVDALVDYIDGNRAVFDAGIAKIPGLKSMPLQSTYLAWVDFSGTGMTRQEFTDRVQKEARIVANHGPTFGKGGDDFLRFNLGAPRAVIEEAVERLAKAFGDLQ